MLRIWTEDGRERHNGCHQIVNSVLRQVTWSMTPDPPERVAKVVRNAERGCFVMQALQNPVPVTGRTVLNGTPLTGAP
jgi:organic hydroperoxide reductase OsmC/OhrA